MAIYHEVALKGEGTTGCRAHVGSYSWAGEGSDWKQDSVVEIRTEDHLGGDLTF